MLQPKSSGPRAGSRTAQLAMRNTIAALLQSQESRKPSSGTGPFGIFAEPAGTDKSCLHWSPKLQSIGTPLWTTARPHQRPSLKRRAAPPMRLSRRGASKTAVADLTHRRGRCGGRRGIPDGKDLATGTARSVTHRRNQDRASSGLDRIERRRLAAWQARCYHGAHGHVESPNDADTAVARQGANAAGQVLRNDIAAVAARLGGRADRSPPKLARHQGRCLPPTRRADPTPNAADVSEGAWDQEPRSQKISSDEGRILSAGEVVNILLRCRYDRSRRIPIARIAAAGGVSRQTLYVAMNTGAVSEQTCVALTPILREIADGTLGFRRRARRWEEIEYFQPSSLAWQDRAVRHEDWNSGRCRTCGGWLYTLVTMGNRLWYLCDQCRPWQTAGMGARPVEIRRRRASSPT